MSPARILFAVHWRQGPRAIAANSVTDKIYTVNYGSKDATAMFRNAIFWGAGQ